MTRLEMMDHPLLQEDRTIKVAIPAVIYARLERHGRVAGRLMAQIVTEALMFHLNVHPDEIEPAGVEA